MAACPSGPGGVADRCWNRCTESSKVPKQQAFIRVVLAHKYNPTTRPTSLGTWLDLSSSMTEQHGLVWCKVPVMYYIMGGNGQNFGQLPEGAVAMPVAAQQMHGAMQMPVQGLLLEQYNPL
eukprot:1216275-Amphidinium_carterae.1